MKKNIYLPLMMMALAIVGCNNAPKQEAGTTASASNETVKENPTEASAPADLSQCDMVLLDNGKLYLYNSEQQSLTPYEAETDSVVNSVFAGDDKVYYCVASGEKILLRCIDLSQPNPQPKQLADWGVPYQKCVTETYGTVSPLVYYQGRNLLGLWHEFSWDSYSLNEQKLYNLATGEITDYDWQAWHEEEMAMQENQADEEYRYVGTEDEFKEYLTTEEGNYYFVDGDPICLTDKIDLGRYVFDPDYASEPEFEYVSSSPDNTKVLFMAILEWGDYPHGPLCISSFDGSYQVALEDTDCSEFKAEWLPDGSLVYVGYEQDEVDEEPSIVPVVKRVYPDGTWELFFRGNDFQVKQSLLH